MNKILSTSWGYDTTNVDYAKIISETPKKVKCVMISTLVSNDDGKGMGRANPDATTVTSEPFMLCKRTCKDGTMYYVGSYPFCGTSKRRGVFSPSSGGEYYNTWD